MGKINSETLTLTLIPKSDEIREENPKADEGKGMGKKGEGVTYLAAGQRYCLVGAREKRRPSRGHCSPGSGQRGAAARPLDGGGLTRWGARTPARGLATAPWLPAPPSSLSVACSVLLC